VRKVNPRIVYGSISGFGQDGPYAGRPGFDQIAQGMGGLMSITGLPGQGPVRVGIPIADLTAGLFCAQGVMVALLEREHHRRGPVGHTSLLKAQIFMLDFQAARWLIEGGAASRPATTIRPASRPACSRPPTAHQHRRTGGAIWERFCRALGAEAMLKNPDYQTAGALAEPQGAQRGDSAAIRRKKSSTHWIETFNKAGVPCGPIYDDRPGVRRSAGAAPRAWRVAQPEVEPFVMSMAETIAGNAPLTVNAIKAIAQEIAKDPDRRDRAGCDRLVEACFASRDYVEGRRAFMEKRKPVFTGA
jgi:crotonobetainyl-CoA:carnitine CoA-transferase CaiB-like acyl-CoA transferase